MKPVYIKSCLTALAVIFALTAYLGWLDEIGERYTQQGLKRSLITYGVARSLNGVISVAQGTELAFEPAGVGLTFTPGQILDPVNDLVERFSWVVLASGASLGVQNILMQVTGWFWFSLTIIACLIFSVLLFWRHCLLSGTARKIIFKTTLVLMIIRFSIPVIAIMNEALYQNFLEPQYVEASNSLQQTTADIEKLNKQQQPLAGDDASFIDKVKSAYQSASNALDIKGHLDSLKSIVAEVSESALNMIVVFVIQTLVFPLLFIWLALQLIKYVINFKLSS
jgi:hypothetical protein